VTNPNLILQQPARRSNRLVLLHHGLGAGPQSLAGLGRRLAAAMPRATVVAVAAPNKSFWPGGRQWYSPKGLSPANRGERVLGALDQFVAVLRQWQGWAHLGPEATDLVGFSQGSIMSLAAVVQHGAVARRVLSCSGQFALLPTAPWPAVDVHFVHGADDDVIPAHHSQTGWERVQSLGGTATLDLIAGLGHALDEAAIQCGIQRLVTEDCT
jgi:phospholipase/carboxylesterase